MLLIYGLKDFGFWLKRGKYHISNNIYGMHVVKKGYAELICEISNDDIAMMIADWKVNGVPLPIAKYFKKKFMKNM